MAELNTSYPLNPSEWAKYRTQGELQFEKEENLSFYIHIPFCQKLCSFCEYTRILCPEKEVQKYYLQVLDTDIQAFVKKYPLIMLHGFDIGGGTPTALSDDSFSYLMTVFQRNVSTLPLSSDFEPSIEGTFQTLSERKLKMISESGIQRLSLGIQSTKNEILAANMRANASLKLMTDLMGQAKSAGIRKINLDLMYGLKGQTLNDMKSDLAALALLKPEQVTLYELRTNMLGVNSYMSSEQLFDSYSTLYCGLRAMGYHARFGQNTFSMDKSDFGVSSYLRHRMLEGMPYKGFGLSAQSMSSYGVSYNIGKNRSDLSICLSLDTYQEEYTYHLPKKELLAKYIAISAYSGRFSLKKASAILEEDCHSYYHDEINFCLNHQLMTIENDILYITRKGFQNYGSVFALFYRKCTESSIRMNQSYLSEKLSANEVTPPSHKILRKKE